MATNSKVFVSPGVYTSEVDLSFVAQSVGVTTLGIVGETLKGPAFEPIFITNFDEFSTYFGGTSPEKFVNTQIPKYEAAYIAKSYLQQSNQLFVTRVLGLSGYDAGPSWSISTVANVDPLTIGRWCTSSTTVNCVTDCVTFNTSAYTATFTGCSDSPTTINLTNTTNIPTVLSEDLATQYELFNGSTSTMSGDLQNQLYEVINNNSLSATSIYYFGSTPENIYSGLTAYTATTNVFGVPSVNLADTDLTDSLNDPWYYATFDNNNGNYTGYSFFNRVTTISATSTVSSCASFYSFQVSSSTISTVTGAINYNNNTISVCLPSTATTANYSAMTIVFSACTSNVKVGGVTQAAITSNVNLTGLTRTYVLTGSDGVTTNTFTLNVTVNDPCGVCASGNTGTINTGTTTTCYSGSVAGTISYFTGTSYTNYDNLIVATMRSRGISTYSSTNDGPDYQVTGVTDVSLDCTGGYSGVLKNPFSTFGISATTQNGTNLFFETSLSTSDSKYISKVFGRSNFGKDRTAVPLFVEETFPTLLTYGYRKGYVRGLNCNLIGLDNARQGVDTSSIANYLEQYQSPTSPWVVSELRGNKVYNLFKFTTISDGDSANYEVKISIVNISFNNGTFDILVRDFFDTDNNPVVLEKFTNCNMNPSDNGYIGKKVGTSDGEYQLNSKYVMVELNEEAPIDALPCGFYGYTTRQYGSSRSPFTIIKSKYDYPGEVIYNPPFGLSSGADDATRSNGDNVRRTYLGISDTIGIDADVYSYKGKQLPLNICTDTTGDDWAYRTKGFHMDINASAITIPDVFATSGQSAFYVGAAEFTSDPQLESNPYYRLYARKFSFLCAGGFDGWDIYREYRTNADRFVLGRSGYLNGSCPSFKYPTATGWGAFKQITGPDQLTWGNTDYYSYLWGQYTFHNPEAININVFTTPGIDYVNNSNLVEEAIDMVETDRADSIYICTTPDYQMFTPTLGDFDTNFIYPEEAVDNLEETGIDSNYTATYYPWILTRDTVNNTQIYLPPTLEVVRNLALTDNIAFPWFASAGYTRGLVNSVKARKKLTQEDRDTLYKGRLNPIATFSDVGTVIWGNKTLQVRESALDRINVRRLLLQARKLISAVAVRLLFEQNDEQVRQEFLDSVNPILDGIRRDRGLIDFRVTVSNTPEDLDSNTLTGKIYLKPTRALEFIDIEFLITPTGASFEDI